MLPAAELEKAPSLVIDIQIRSGIRKCYPLRRGKERTNEAARLRVSNFMPRIWTRDTLAIFPPMTEFCVASVRETSRLSLRCADGSSVFVLLSLARGDVGIGGDSGDHNVSKNDSKKGAKKGLSLIQKAEQLCHK